MKCEKCNHKIKKRKSTDVVFDYLMEKNLAVTKKRLYEKIKLRRSTIDKACTILRKENKIGLYKWKYWGTNI